MAFIAFIAFIVFIAFIAGAMAELEAGVNRRKFDRGGVTQGGLTKGHNPQSGMNCILDAFDGSKSGACLQNTRVDQPIKDFNSPTMSMLNTRSTRTVFNGAIFFTGSFMEISTCISDSCSLEMDPVSPTYEAKILWQLDRMIGYPPEV